MKAKRGNSKGYRPWGHLGLLKGRCPTVGYAAVIALALWPLAADATSQSSQANGYHHKSGLHPAQAQLTNDLLSARNWSRSEDDVQLISALKSEEASLWHEADSNVGHEITNKRQQRADEGFSVGLALPVDALKRSLVAPTRALQTRAQGGREASATATTTTTGAATSPARANRAAGTTTTTRATRTAASVRSTTTARDKTTRSGTTSTKTTTTTKSLPPLRGWKEVSEGPLDALKEEKDLTLLAKAMETSPLTQGDSLINRLAITLFAPTDTALSQLPVKLSDLEKMVG